MVVTDDTFQLLICWLKGVPENILPILVAEDMFQSPIDWLNALTQLNL